MTGATPARPESEREPASPDIGLSVQSRFSSSGVSQVAVLGSNPLVVSSDKGLHCSQQRGGGGGQGYTADRGGWRGQWWKIGEVQTIKRRLMAELRPASIYRRSPGSLW